jgi:hypothetical protein
VKHQLTMPDGQVVIHSSEKRYHVVSLNLYGRPVRRTSSSTRSLALANWRTWHSPAWLIDGETNEVIRTPDSPRLAGSVKR